MLLRVWKVTLTASDPERAVDLHEHVLGPPKPDRSGHFAARTPG